MSKTLFWYIFWNLLKIFLLTTAGLAGIMSFAGLLRPLTENGLDMGQVNRLLIYMMPAMCTYSLPVAALFAATMVYGRFSSDNELTAMRAGGISYLSLRRFSIALPALVLGLMVATISLAMLCFVVPYFSLRVEEVIYSNIAKVIANRIEKSHEVDLKGSDTSSDASVFAQEAHLLPADPSRPDIQMVELIGPAITPTESVQLDPSQPAIAVPREFWMASRAVVTIQRDPKAPAWQPAQLFVRLYDGLRFPREISAEAEGGVAETTFGPREITSPITENVKFMDVTRLRQLAADPSQSSKIIDVTNVDDQRLQQRKFYVLIADKIAGQPDAAFDFPPDPDTGDQFRIGGQGAICHGEHDELVINAPPINGNERTVWLIQSHGSQEIFVAHARELRVRATGNIGDSPGAQSDRMTISVGLEDTDITTTEGGSERSSFSRSFPITMPPELQEMRDRNLDDYLHDPRLIPQERAYLRHEEIVVINSVTSELHGRASFALSCLVLVMVGCALGSMFRSGNLLNAFAVSFVPALLCITLIVCGQQAATHVPFDMGPTFHNPLKMSLWFIWIGNAIVLATAIYLTGRLQRR